MSVCVCVPVCLSVCVSLCVRFYSHFGLHFAQEACRCVFNFMCVCIASNCECKLLNDNVFKG